MSAADQSAISEARTAFLDYQFNILGISNFLNNPDITEICINGPGQIFVESKTGWEKVPVEQLTYERARQFCTAVVNESNTGQSITSSQPLVSFTFPTGQRAQFVIPPACEAGQISITIRLPSRKSFSLEEYRLSGFFDKIQNTLAPVSESDYELIELKQKGDFAAFFSKAVFNRKNIVVAGATGSGKTTFMRALVEHIPHNERLVTIEDARELFISQPNRVHLLYSKGGQSTAKISAKDCMEACLRMKPDRILLAEIRGDEAFFFIRNCASGHPGSISSCHAGSADQAWEQLALMIKASPEGAGLEYEVIKKLLRLTVDIMVHISSHRGRRFITGIDFKAESQSALQAAH
jgi:type IV secretion system protein VirB11